MKTITKLLIPLILALSCHLIEAQEVGKDSTKVKVDKTLKEEQIQKLIARKKQIENEEREFLKSDIEAINRKLDAKKITASEAEKLKKEAARTHAANIANRLAIIDNKIELIERNPYTNIDFDFEEGKLLFEFGRDGVRFNLTKPGKRKPPKYDIRTKNKLLLAVGLNNTLIDGQSLEDSPYTIAGSRFFELGWLWETRLFKNSHFTRINYGFSFQWNKLDIKNDQFFVQEGNVTTLQDFPGELNRAKFRVANLVFPVHFEFGPYKKKDYKNRIRYNTWDQFKVGIGGYGGFRLGSRQKLRFKEDGNRVKQKQKRNFNTSNFVYGLSAYVGIGNIALYCKYDLNPLFKNQAVDQNNISLGVRFDLD